MEPVREIPRSPGLALALVAILGVGLAATRPQLETVAGHGGDCANVRQPARTFVRTELYFGLSRGGGAVSEAEFESFVAAQVAPRFPSGSTLVDGTGRFRDAAGGLVAERSKLLILLYPATEPEVDSRIEHIREEYRRRFEQEAVLRNDARACVSP